MVEKPHPPIGSGPGPRLAVLVANYRTAAFGLDPARFAMTWMRRRLARARVRDVEYRE